MTDLALVGLAPELLEQAVTPARLTSTLGAAPHITLTLEADTEANTIDTVIAAAGVTGITWDEQPYKLAGVRHRGSRITLTFEDHLVAALRAIRDPLMVPAASTTRPELVQRLCVEAGVACDVEPTPVLIPTVTRRTDSWSTIRDLGWRATSDSDQLVVGSEDWLLARRTPLQAERGSGGVRDLEVSMWTNKPACEATLTVEDSTWRGQPGDAALLPDIDDETWLVVTRTHDADAETATVVLTRGPWQPEGTVAWPS